ncbi:MAG: hypothetical protein HY050_01825 [Actinobacteria bacterium]|nr:hypothetical protein [Actinomycetota bacterium]
MILISEDVWGIPFDELQKKYLIHRDPNLWKDISKLKHQLNKAEVLVVRNQTRVTRDLIAHSPQLKLIVRAGVGLDNIDIAAADESDIVVVAGFGANAESVGEFTIGLGLALLRQIPKHDGATHSGNWNRFAGRQISGLTWGLLGCGATGLATAQLLQGFNLHILAFDPFLSPSNSKLARLGISLRTLERVLGDSDVISIHLPSNSNTKGLINVKTLGLMKTHAVLINVGRGEVINESDLITALKTKIIAGAALDVRANEPPTVGELESLPNVILTPHVAGITNESQSRINEILASNIDLVLRGKPATHAVGTVKEASR